AVEQLMQLAKINIQKEIYEGRLKAQRDALALADAVAQAEQALAKSESERERAESERAQAMARAAELEALARGNVVARIHLMQKLLRQTETPTAELEQMTLESLTALVGQLERELPR
ncbi:MAG TPA: hypothetical protein VFJ58_02835, partial [Armatimonadota bacterium]|nr:hypothetical protein [Armatimonadota bacterium]